MRGALREFNGCHEPAGTPDKNSDGRGDGGHFATRGVCHPTGHSKTETRQSIPYRASDEVEARWDKDFGKTGVTLQMLVDAYATGLTPTAANAIPAKVKWDDDEEGYAFTVYAGKAIVQRVIRPGRGHPTAMHDVLLLAEGQGAGLGKRMLAETFRLYETLGVTDVDMKANIDVGSYAWARYGFDYDPTASTQQNAGFYEGTLKRANLLADWNLITAAQARDFAKASVTPGGGIWKVADTKMKLPPSQARAVVDGFLNSPLGVVGMKPVPLVNNLTAETTALLRADADAGVVPVGKLLLLDRYWSARFRLNNSGQRDRLRAYVGRDVFKD